MSMQIPKPFQWRPLLSLTIWKTCFSIILLWKKFYRIVVGLILKYSKLMLKFDGIRFYFSHNLENYDVITRSAVVLRQGDQIGRLFDNWATLKSSLWFLKTWSCPKSGDILGNFLLKQILYIFNEICTFKTQLFIRIFCFKSSLI